MRIITCNVNGIRSAARKGFFAWLAEQDADVVCLQETKAQIHQLTAPEFHPEGYHCFYHDAIKKGYSGVALYAKQEPQSVQQGLGWPVADDEGRCLRAEFANVGVASLYLPSGTSSDERQAVKYDFLDQYLQQLKALVSSKKPWILCGDWNIAHKNIDLKNWRSNQKNSGFLPEERAWLDHLFDEVGFIDAFRAVNQEPDQYTWWSNRAQAWANNVGWRIDYHIVTPNLAGHVHSAAIYRDEKFSDHAPLTIDYTLP